MEDAMSGFYTTGLPAATTLNGGLPLSGTETYPCDTNHTQGITPATVALSGATVGAIGIGPQQNLGSFAAGTIVVDASTGSNFIATLAGVGLTLQVLNPSPGQLVDIELKQDASGSRTITTWQTKVGAAAAQTVRWAGGTAPTLTTTAAATDDVQIRYGGTGVTAAAGVPYGRGLATLALA
jgi:hypothetical protein